MRASIGPWRVVLGLVGFGAVAASVGCGGDEEEEGLGVIRRRFETSVNILRVTASEGNIVLRGSDTRVVEVRFTPDREGDNFQGQPAGGILSLGSVCQDGQAGCGGAFEITAPEDIEFRLTTELGAVTLEGLGFRGEVNSLSGLVTGTDLGQLEITIDATQASDQDLSFRLAPVGVTMSTGGDGQLSVELPSGTGYAFDLETTGNINRSGQITEDDDGPVITMRSGSGDITIQPSN